MSQAHLKGSLLLKYEYCIGFPISEAFNHLLHKILRLSNVLFLHFSYFWTMKGASSAGDMKHFLKHIQSHFSWRHGKKGLSSRSISVSSSCGLIEKKKLLTIRQRINELRLALSSLEMNAPSFLFVYFFSTTVHIIWPTKISPRNNETPFFKEFRI